MQQNNLQPQVEQGQNDESHTGRDNWERLVLADSATAVTWYLNADVLLLAYDDCEEDGFPSFAETPEVLAHLSRQPDPHPNFAIHYTCAVDNFDSRTLQEMEPNAFFDETQADTRTMMFCGCSEWTGDVRHYRLYAARFRLNDNDTLDGEFDVFLVERDHFEIFEDLANQLVDTQMKQLTTAFVSEIQQQACVLRTIDKNAREAISQEGRYSGSKKLKP